MKIIVIAPYYFNSAPSQRYRIEQWAPHVKDKDIKFDYLLFCDERLQKILYLKGSYLRKFTLFVKCYIKTLLRIINLKGYDIVFLHKGVSPTGVPILEYLLNLKKIPIIYDFDDAVYLFQHGQARGIWIYLKCPWKVKYICRIAAHVIAGNRVLSEYALQFNKHVSVVPSSIDTDLYFIKKHTEKKHIVLGWTGSHSVCYNLKIVEQVLIALKKIIDYEFIVISDCEFDLGFDYTFIKWNPATETEDLAKIDIGIMPLFDGEWERGKCGLKILQYMGMGIPAVASPIGANKEIIEDGVNGFLVDSDKEWINRLSLLINDFQLREKLGLAGRKSVKARYSAVMNASILLDIIKTVQGYK